MATNWKEPTGADLWKVLLLDIVEKADQDEEGHRQETNDLDESNTETRRYQLVEEAVAEFRAAIRTAGRIPLSVTPDAVPPECVRHVLNIAAYQLVNSTPSLAAAVLHEQTSLKSLYDEAIKKLEQIQQGAGLTPPTDPTGLDWTTAVSASNPAISAVTSAAIVGEVDLSTPSTSGGADYTGGANPNGNQVGNVGDIYYQTSGGSIIKTWQKITGNGTNTGWA